MQKNGHEKVAQPECLLHVSLTTYLNITKSKKDWLFKEQVKCMLATVMRCRSRGNCVASTL